MKSFGGKQVFFFTRVLKNPVISIDAPKMAAAGRVIMLSDERR